LEQILRFVAVLALAFAAFPSWAATLVHRPYLQNMSRDRVTVVWSTRENVTGIVQFSTDTSYSRSVTARVRSFPTSQTGMAIPFFQYQADLTALSPATTYNYRVMADGQNLTPEPERRFRTPAPGAFTFLAFGDSGLGTQEQRTISDLMAAEHPDFVIHVGDIAYESGTFEQFTANYFEYYWTLMRRVPFFPVPGNHEYYSLGAAPYMALNPASTDTIPPSGRGRYYSFDWGDVHFAALDSNVLDLTVSPGDMMDWLEADLQASAARWKIAYFHHLPYPISHHLDDPVCAAVRTLFVPVLERNGVQLVLDGHEHTYERTLPMRGDVAVTSGRAITYVTTGGGGGIPHPVAPAPFLATAAAVFHYLRVEADASQITIHAIGQDGKEFDHLVLTLPSIGSGGVVNAASFGNVVSAGSLISIFGQGLSNETGQASRFPLPLGMEGASVTLNGNPIPLTFASPGQINAQLPFDVQGPAVMRVTTPTGTADSAITITAVAPGIFSTGVRHANGRLVSAAAPVVPGEPLVLYGTGFGQVDGAITIGQPSPSSPLLKAVAPVEVLIGDRSVAPFFAGLTPGAASVFQVNVVVPADLPPRTYPLRVSINGVPSNTTNVLVQSP
jgi:uncharacterized protein (TIGR03437 family)